MLQMKIILNSYKITENAEGKHIHKRLSQQCCLATSTVRRGSIHKRASHTSIANTVEKGRLQIKDAFNSHPHNLGKPS